MSYDSAGVYVVDQEQITGSSCHFYISDIADPNLISSAYGKVLDQIGIPPEPMVRISCFIL